MNDTDFRRSIEAIDSVIQPLLPFLEEKTRTKIEDGLYEIRTNSSRTIDRQQGVWEPHEKYDPEIDDGTEVYYTCSVCGRVEYSPEHFCPECGSEMTAGELD